MSKHENKHEKEAAKHAHKERRRKIKTSLGWIVTAGVVLSIIYFAVTAPRVASGDVESNTGIHYHPRLTIEVNGQNVVIPNLIGLNGPTESPIHTHEEGDGTIHLEFNGLVKKDDIRLQKFFNVWGKEWTATSFMGNPINAEHTLTMTVNGNPSTEYGNFIMHDKDEIKLTYK